MLNLVIILLTLAIAAYLAFSKHLRSSTAWKATITPLASIMGSGFLVSAPLLGGIVGYYATFCMLGLLIIAYGLGSVIRFNIQHYEPISDHPSKVRKLATTSQLFLAIAYFISITFYLQLLAAFSLSRLEIDSEMIANIVTSGLLLSIGIIAIWKGLAILESIEKYAVALNLAMIASLIFSLAYYNISLFSSGEWKLPPTSTDINLTDVRILLGLLIVVQGFETSRYLGDTHSAEERIQTMRWAQIISSIIYIVFLSLITVLFQSDMSGDVTAIIDMVHPVATVLPLLIVIAAVGSQFTAAVADDEGAGGLIEEITHNKIPIRYAYFIILAITLALTWITDVNQIIAYASRAFAFYYFLQCLIAICVLKQKKAHCFKMALFCLLALTCLTVAIAGISAE